MMTEPIAGQLRGIGLRLDPQEILIAPSAEGGLTWGYTIIDKTNIPTMYMDGEWRDVVPKGVWLQMLDNWDDVIKTIKNNQDEFSHYLGYPEIKDAIDE
jgi:hypothetical protein